MKNISFEIKYQGHTLVAGSLWNLIISGCFHQNPFLQPVVGYELERLCLEVTIPAHHLAARYGDLVVIDPSPESWSDDT